MKIAINKPTSQDLANIKIAIDGLENPKEDRRDHLEYLFEMHTKFYGKSWSQSSQTCGSCVKQVKAGMLKILQNGYGK
tara:strand:- start:1167 stop:1400 length:234 start_codon:yes stop_codon:yes gene_type:complete